MKHPWRKLWFGDPQAFGDCSSCGHSIAYHTPIFGCMKCDCDEYH